MSQTPPSKRQSVRTIRARKSGEPIVCLTAYTAPMARLLDPHVDLLLVGDSVGTVLHGHETTVQVTLEDMIHHGLAVTHARPNALVVIDLPFGSYEASPVHAFEAASRVLKETGADAVKLEGGGVMAETISFLTQRGVAVMAHIGLQPQSVLADGGYRIVGRDRAEWRRLHEDAKAVDEAGAFAVVLEGVVEPLAREITDKISIPTIGIGASPVCDGQILVTEDMLGFFERTPKFVREYAELRTAIDRAIAAYAKDVRSREFPGADECYDEKKPGK